jgi:hypothetical protein
MICYTDEDYEIILDALEAYKHKKHKPVDNPAIDRVLRRTRNIVFMRSEKNGNTE